MEKTNELNKFLSYIHMGTAVYRIYYNEAVKLKDQLLINHIVKIQEVFKTHEEKITKLINSFDEEATNSLTAAGIFGVYKEKMKIFDNSFMIITSAIKATNMGMLSALSFLKENNELSNNVKEYIKIVISDYEAIQNSWIKYIFQNQV